MVIILSRAAPISHVAPACKSPAGHDSVFRPVWAPCLILDAAVVRDKARHTELEQVLARVAGPDCRPVWLGSQGTEC